MSILDRFRRARPELKVFNRREVKSFPLYQMIPRYFGFTAKWSQYSTAQALLAYKKSVWLYDCLTLRANNISGVPWVVQVRKGKKWEETSEHDLAGLLQRPNPEYDLPTMMVYAMGWLDTTGDAWGTKVRNGAGQTMEWWPSLPDSMEAIPGRQRMVDSWRYRYCGESAILPAQDVIHFKYVDPSSLYYGLSPLQAAARSVDIDMEASNFQKVELQNHGIRPGAFKGPADMTQDQFEQGKKWIDEESGPEWAKKPMILNGFDWIPMNSTPQELDYNESRKTTRVEICSAYGVPMPLVGVYDDATLANIQTSRRIFWMEVLSPILRKLEGQLNLQLASEFGPDVRITYDLSGVEALQEDMNLKITAARELWSMGVPLEQVNQVMDLGLDTDEIEGAEVGYLPSGLLPANFDATADDPGPGGEGAAKVTYGEGKPEPTPAAAAPEAPVANTAMDGTQVTALQGIAQAVADGMMPAESAIQLILVSFPSIGADQARAIIGPMEGFEQAKPESQPAPTFGTPPAPFPPKGKPEDEGGGDG